MLEDRIAEWRAYLGRRQAIHAVDVDELEDHLRTQVSDLQAAGLDTEEAFLIAVKRIGDLDALSQEYAREYSERLWKRLVMTPGAGAGGWSREATVAVVGKHVTAGIANSTNLPDMIRQKKVRSLGVASAVRLGYLPDTPTFKELGFPTVRTVTRQVLVGPPGMSAKLQNFLAKVTAKAVADPDFVKLSNKQKFSLGPMEPKGLGKEINDTFGSISELLKAVKKKK